jgi:protein translocase SEC61 complex gamma subunit
MVDILEQSTAFQRRVDAWIANRRRGRYMRVLRLAVRPETEEYMNTVKLAFAGLLVLGVTGFLMQLLSTEISHFLGGLF